MEFQLEPRLAEYARRLNLYKQNGVKPKLPLEKLFNITLDDLVLLKNWEENQSVYEFEKPINRGMFASDDPKRSPYDEISKNDDFDL